MRIVGLLAFRDEAPYLPAFLASITPLVDVVVALDDRSTDSGSDLLRAAGAIVAAAPDGVGFGRRRAALLHAGRAAGGTHFVAVDADEVFSATFVHTGREHLERLAPGESLAFPFRTLWKGVTRYRIGREYDMPLPVAFCDDGVLQQDSARIHETRLPGDLGLRSRVVAAEAGEMFHLQFAAWHRSQIKQAWYRCKELLDGSSAARVNARYVGTLDGPFVRTRPVSSDALGHLPSLSALSTVPPSWHLEETIGWLRRYGPARFERLQIWHVDELREEFQRLEGRTPRAPRLTPHLVRAGGDIYGGVRARVRRMRATGKQTPHR